ncbi:sperm associated antigen 8 isoform X2 [Simochromis diagramma]|uniref:sperm associated antigen 8 isoform X2 n=1 Tax=Simochromis diagramma TaxID=43689 RepID=UPI001A7E64FF|nr:sperm associated antigen 8 isoform X2 [Simochromis diagramma]
MTEQTAAVGHKVGKPMLHNWVEERAIADLHTEDPETHKHIHGHKGILTIDLESKMESVTTLKAAYVAPKSPVGRLQGIRGELLKKHTAQMIRKDLEFIQPSIFCCLSGSRLCGQQRCPDLPLAPPPLANLGEAKAFPSQPRDIVSPQHVLVLPRGFTNLSEEVHGRHKCPNHFSWLLSIEKIHADLNPLTPKTEYCSTTQKDFCVEGFVPHKPETTRVHDYKTDQAITFWSENCQRIQGVTAARSSKGPFRKSALFSTPITERLDEIDLPPDN